jgi:hypothetical protein
MEYTAPYCGKKTLCPTCGHTITFPAIPPARGAAAPATGPATGPAPRQKPGQKPAAKAGPAGSGNSKGTGDNLRDFQHWNVVVQCAVPFLIVAVLLAGAVFVKKNFGSPAAPVPELVVQPEPGAWNRMTELTKADEAVRAEIQEVTVARSLLASAQRMQLRLQSGDAMQRKGAADQVEAKQRLLAAAQKRFQTAFANYQKLGGKVDYRAQLPNN